ncbi:hypothetical protein CHS0354_028594 [Potamilus streckersoni]|uniref:Uncharacterized protein n=1 Tax=Potamilus streckersoni TaxID=2493646 RepID=A0AAE0VZP9_9BIVA|nr:hypothetical protein CHS0354_028594 [Potamilus streckersoni]
MQTRQQEKQEISLDEVAADLKMSSSSGDIVAGEEVEEEEDETDHTQKGLLEWATIFQISISKEHGLRPNARRQNPAEEHCYQNSPLNCSKLPIFNKGLYFGLEILF